MAHVDQAERRARLKDVSAELEAVVRETEAATHRIMAAAEAVMRAADGEPAAFKTIVEKRMTEVFEACGFQDLNGQRLRRAGETLAQIETTRAARRRRARVSNKPAEQADQAAVDKLFS